MPPPDPVKISHKDVRQRLPHRCHVSWSPLPGRWISYCPFSSLITMLNNNGLNFVTCERILRIEFSHRRNSLQSFKKRRGYLLQEATDDSDPVDSPKRERLGRLLTFSLTRTERDETVLTKTQQTYVYTFIHRDHCSTLARTSV